MNGRLKLHLKANERIYINGAVLRVDRKVAIELLNDVVFLLEGHVMQQEEAKTPLRQLYFVVQSMLIEPQAEPLARQIYEQQHSGLIAAFRNKDVLAGLEDVKLQIERGKIFEALKRIRSLFAIEDDVLRDAIPDTAVAKAVA
ncbi:MAG: flagellar biosynthesis repressor FlbT [Hyphomicrobiaceae bacterium]|uniref:flagellar biosynthesis repressor FlbT n=1 Tax=Pseudorhodoplanes sp. TaxID=1934341 RepID=UPI003D0AC06B